MPYVQALQCELADLITTGEDRQLKSLFIGGGTPSILPCTVLTELVGACLTLFQPMSKAEVSVEANPGTVDESYLRRLLLAGVNRISLGVQTFNDRELSVLGRTHGSREANAAVLSAKRAGFKNINLDLMYGLPGQTVESYKSSLQQAISLRPQHLSLYQLTIEEGTPFHQALLANRISLPDEEEILLMDEVTAGLCDEAKFLQYEISNYSIAGYECKHNINYWENEDYLACGASAVSCVKGVREKRIADPSQYIKSITERRSVLIERECLSAEASFRESVIMGLRMTRGVSLQRLADRYDIDIVNYYGNTLKKLRNFQLLELTDSHLKLTPKGRPLANLIMAELV